MTHRNQSEIPEPSIDTEEIDPDSVAGEILEATEGARTMTIDGQPMLVYDSDAMDVSTAMSLAPEGERASGVSVSVSGDGRDMTDEQIEGVIRSLVDGMIREREHRRDMRADQ